MRASFGARITACSRTFFRRASGQTAAKTTNTWPKHQLQPKISRLTFADSEPWSVPKRRLALLAALTVFGVSMYATNRYVSGPRRTITASQVPTDVSDRYNKIARKFDSDVGFIEAVYGYGWLRSWITNKASGHVLEVSAGTGRNSEYYNLKDCKSITFIDSSEEMVKIAEEKFRKNHPGYKSCRFITQSALDSVASPQEGFDTILQTMGICSVAEPVRLLRHLTSLVNPDHGRILLLEHGKSYYDWLNTWLDSSAAEHADKFGCWWNKDIGQIINESGLEVVKLKRYHFGTTWWIELKLKGSQSASSPKS